VCICDSCVSFVKMRIHLVCLTKGRFARSGKFSDGKFSASGSEVCKGKSFSSVKHGLS